MPVVLALSKEARDNSTSQDLSLGMVFNLSESNMIAVMLFPPGTGVVSLDQPLAAAITV